MNRFKLEKIDDYRWRVPKENGMRVEGRIYASEEMLSQIEKDNAIQQVKNVAYLPGIVNYSLAMPDIHWGYGFCLTGESKILTEFGYYKSIRSFENEWKNRRLKIVNMELKRITNSTISKFLKLKSQKVYKITTELGYTIKATPDHPIFTPYGMKLLKDINNWDKVAVLPFDGVKYEKPSAKIIISEIEIKNTLLKLNRKPGAPGFDMIINKLKKRNLIRIGYNHEKMPYILKIMGFIFGDGSMNFIGKRGDGILNFSGKKEDLEAVRNDIRKIGYTPGPIHLRRIKSSENSNKYYNCYSFYINASSLVVLLETLGVPRGSKVDKEYRLPSWIFKATLWQKRLFLASLFGCELRVPHRRLNRRGYFDAPVFSMGKREDILENGKEFLNDIRLLLEDFGVKTLYINIRKRHISKKGNVTYLLDLVISPKMENLINLWGKIGFEYNYGRSFMANIALQYLKFRRKIIKEKEMAISFSIPFLLKKGLSYKKIADRLANSNLTERFIKDVCYKLKRGKKILPRIPADFPDFEEFIKDRILNLGKCGLVWDKIIKIKEISHKGYVYDFTISNKFHNFIANKFVVSNCIGGVAAMDIDKGGVISPGGVGYDINCGVRLVKTNLKEEEVKLKLESLMVSFYNNIPSGVGSKGKLKLSEKELKKVLIKGSEWAVENGYGEKEDIDNTEEGGRMKSASYEYISRRAIERGLPQLGTLGSGNHFLEVQKVVEIYDEDVAKKWGVFAGQIVIMIHSGSRGLGYQVCDDYVRELQSAVNKYGIKIPDRQLVCVPFNSPEGKRYFESMSAAANYAWCNRQIIMHWVRESFFKVFGISPKDAGLELLYDVAHNIGKLENYKEKKLIVHRKGATRSLPKGHELLPEHYRDTGQPVIIPGSMGTESYLLVGGEKAEETFYSTSHGAGRQMSRREALRRVQGFELKTELESKGIVVETKSMRGLAEESPEAYKDVSEVVEVCVKSGISKKVARMVPVGVVKG